MGGYGSTRWDWHDKADTVEDCKELSIFDMKRDGILKPKYRRFGSWVWSNRFTGKRTANISYELNTLNMSYAWLRLEYTVTKWHGEKYQRDYKVPLQTTTPHFGGLRWWFICPLTVNGKDCGRRVGKLYLPQSGTYFGCRHCHKLTYRSCQESDMRLNLLRKNPMAIRALMESDNPADVLKAYRASMANLEGVMKW